MSQFNRGEYVICLSPVDNQWHRAKIVKRDGTSSRYKVHYVGWGNIWDEWLSDDRVSKGSKNEEICKELINKKIMEAQREEQSKQYRLNGKVKMLPLSRAIKKSLMDQFEITNKHQILMKLPKEKDKTINKICNEFIRFQSDIIRKNNKLNPSEECLYLRQIIGSITFYFNHFININILFQSELEQKKELIRNMNGNEIDYTKIYGIEHLFRLIYLLPEIYGKIKDIEPMQAAKISNYVSLFAAFLTKNIERYHSNLISRKMKISSDSSSSD